MENSRNFRFDFFPHSISLKIDREFVHLRSRRGSGSFIWKFQDSVVKFHHDDVDDDAEEDEDFLWQILSVYKKILI